MVIEVAGRARGGEVKDGWSWRPSGGEHLWCDGLWDQLLEPRLVYEPMRSSPTCKVESYRMMDTSLAEGDFLLPLRDYDVKTGRCWVHR